MPRLPVPIHGYFSARGANCRSCQYPKYYEQDIEVVSTASYCEADERSKSDNTSGEVGMTLEISEGSVADKVVDGS